MKKIKSLALLLWVLLSIQKLHSQNTPQFAFPVYFEQNIGQINNEIAFIARFDGYQAGISKNGLTFYFSHRKQNPIKIQFVDSDPAIELTGINQLTGKVNYLKGNQPDNWITNIPIFSRIHYDHAFLGIDIEFYEKDNMLEYDFIIRPEQDVSRIQLKVDGANEICLDASGCLQIITPGDTLIQSNPVAYQDIEGNRVEVDCRYVVQDSYITFQTGDYNKAYNLTIDPYVMVFSSFLGGGNFENANAVATDSEGYIYTTGSTQSVGLGTDDIFQNEHAELGDDLNWDDVFLAKISPDGNNLIYYTYLGGERTDRGHAIAVLPDGTTYICGGTSSEDFPVAAATMSGFQTEHAGIFDSFLAVFSADGTTLNYCSFLGGEASDQAYGVELTDTEEAFIIGETRSLDFPTRSAFDDSKDGGDETKDLFIARFNPSLAGNNGLVFSTYLGGSQEDGLDNLIAFEVDFIYNSINNALYLTGFTESTDFPIRGANVIQETLNGPRDAFFVKIDGDGESLLYSTFLGGAATDIGAEVAGNRDIGIYLAGHTNSEDFVDDFITPNALHATGSSIFLIRLVEVAEDEFTLDYGTFLPQGNVGTVGAQMGHAVADIVIDGQGNIGIGTITNQEGLEISQDAFQNNLNGENDVYFQLLSPNAQERLYSTYLGGTSGERVTDIGVDLEGNFILVGSTRSEDYVVFPNLPPPFQPEYGGPPLGAQFFGDAFITKIGPKPLQVNYEYTAKIICGRQPDSTDLRVTLGIYGTSINVHNPWDEESRFFKKLALTYPPGDQLPGDILPIAEDVLQYDEALAVDCNDIEQRLFPNGLPTPYIEGYVVIQSENSLDVTGVYTTAALNGGGNFLFTAVSMWKGFQKDLEKLT